MKFQLKALAAALVLAAAVPAHATVTTAASGNSSLILTVLDTVAGVSATFDLGKSYSDFNQVATAGVAVATPAATLAVNLSSAADYSAAWSAYFSNGATLANSVFQIEAADNTGNPGAGSRGYVVSLNTSRAATTIVSSSLITATGNFDTYINNAVDLAQTVYSNHDTAANGASVVKSGYGYAGAAFYQSGRAGSTSGPFSFAALGSTMGLTQYVVSASNFGNATSSAFSGYTVNLASNGDFTIAAVPEPETYAMLIAGLGLMGFSARRKQA